MRRRDSTPLPDILTREEAAEYLRTSYATLDSWRKHGGGPRVFRLTPRGKFLYRLVDIDAWVAVKVREQEEAPE